MADEKGELESKTAENGDAAASVPTCDEERLLQAARDKDVSEVTRLSSQWNIKIDHFDKNGMTALMHAAYKGDHDSVDVLITHGSDVNRKSSDHEYTPLMFATLAGSTKCVQFLLDAGADPTLTNKIGKTATQLGAFVGRHECVSLVNNYIAKHDIEYYTRPQGLETEAKLASFLAEPLQRFIIITNLHPVFVALFLQENIALVENSAQVMRILDLKRERLFKKEVNEVMAMKVHCFACVYEKCVKWHNSEDGIEGLIRKFVKGRESDGFPLDLEDFLRESIRSFPYRESNLFKQLVRTIYPVIRGNEPTALSALTQSINGLQSANFTSSCFTCGQGNSKKKCAKCKVARYCSQDCQKRHWFTHKKHCKAMGLRHQKQLEEQAELEQLQQEAAAKEKAEKEAASLTQETKENCPMNGGEKDEVAEQSIDAEPSTEKQTVQSS